MSLAMLNRFPKLNTYQWWQTLKARPLHSQTITYSSIGWGLFLTYSVLYCRLYGLYVEKNLPTAMDSIFWISREYGLCLIATPVLALALSRLWHKHKGFAFALLTLTWAAITSYRVALELYENNDSVLSSNLVLFAPTYLCILTFILLSWALLIRPQLSQTTQKPSPLPPNSTSENKPPTLTVQSGTQDVILEVTKIESISAAGNYMEVFDGNKYYILRTTMKELEQQLSAQVFMRVHRSHLVNRSLIIAIKHDNQLVLSSGQSLPYSRKYQRNIQQYQGIM